MAASCRSEAEDRDARKPPTGGYRPGLFTLQDLIQAPNPVIFPPLLSTEAAVKEVVLAP